MRRRKKILKKLLKIFVFVGIILIIYFAFFKRIKKIDSGNESNNQTGIIELRSAEEPKVEIVLPDKIYDEIDVDNTNTSSNDNSTNETTATGVVNTDKKYSPITSDDEIINTKKYLETITNNEEITVMLGDDSRELLSDNSPIEIGKTYIVNNVTEPMKTTYSFNIEGYDYPIILALSQTGYLYYIDAEQAFKTGNFQITQKIEEIKDDDKVYETIVEENGKKYSTAVITTKNGEGYEFNLKMINK